MNRSIIFLLAMVYCTALKADLQGELTTLKKKLTVLHNALPVKLSIDEVVEQAKPIFKQIKKTLTNALKSKKPISSKQYETLGESMGNKLRELAKDLNPEELRDIGIELEPLTDELADLETQLQFERLLPITFEEGQNNLYRKLDNLRQLLVSKYDTKQFVKKAEIEPFYQFYHKLMNLFNEEQKEIILKDRNIKIVIQIINNLGEHLDNMHKWDHMIDPAPWWEDIEKFEVEPEVEFPSSEEEEEISEGEEEEKPGVIRQHTFAQTPAIQEELSNDYKVLAQLENDVNDFEQKLNAFINWAKKIHAKKQDTSSEESKAYDELINSWGHLPRIPQILQWITSYDKFERTATRQDAQATIEYLDNLKKLLEHVANIIGRAWRDNHNILNNISFTFEGTSKSGVGHFNPLIIYKNNLEKIILGKGKGMISGHFDELNKSLHKWHRALSF